MTNKALTTVEIAERYPRFVFVGVDEAKEPILVHKVLFSNSSTDPGFLDEAAADDGSVFDELTVYETEEECINNSRASSVLVCEYTLTRVTEIKRTNKSRQIFPKVVPAKKK